MMHSPAMGVGYFLWRRLRWPLVALLANVALLAVVSRVFASSEYRPFVVICTLLPLVIGSIHLLSVFTYGPSDFGASNTGFPRYMLVQPMSARSMVGWPMLYGALTVAFLCMLTLRAAPFPPEAKIPICIFAGFFIASLAWFQVSAWISFPFPVLRALFVVVMVILLCGGGVWAMGHEWSEVLVTAGYFAMTLLAYSVAVVGLSRARCGQGQAWSLAPLWERWVASLWKPSSFRSPLRAQLWLELRRNTFQLSLLTLFMCLPILLPLLGKQRNEIYIAGVSVSARMMAVSILIACPIFFSSAFSAAMGKFDFWSNKVPTFNSFYSTRAFSTTSFILSKWLTAAVSTAVVWIILLAMLAVFFLSSTAAEQAKILQLFGPSAVVAAGRIALVALLLMFVTWRNQVTGFFIPMLGQAWFTHTLMVVSWLQVAMLGGLGMWAVKVPEVRDRITSYLPAILGAIAVVKVVIAIIVVRMLRQRSIVPASQWKKLSAIWIASAVALFAILCGITGPRAMLIPVAILMLPMVRIALAPLTLSLNRHR